MSGKRKHEIGGKFFTRNFKSSLFSIFHIFYYSQYMYDDDVMHKFMQNYDVLHVETNGWKKNKKSLWMDTETRRKMSIKVKF